MDRRDFLRRIGATASLAAASPLLGEAIAGNKSSISGEPATAFVGSLHPGSSGSALLHTELAANFVDPPASAAPWVYWVWLGVDTTPAAMTYDLEQMKAKGIAGFILYGNQAGSMPSEIPKRVLVEKDNRFTYEFVPSEDFDDFHVTPIPFPPLEAWTPLWRERIRYVAKESARLGLKFCLAMGLAGTSGNIPEEYGNQELLWTETTVHGPGDFDAILPVPGTDRARSTYHRDVSVIAIPDRSDFHSSEAIDLTAQMDAGGRLRWKPPAGRWKILRFSQRATDVRNQWGIFSDAMNPQALDKLWDVTMAPLLKEMSPDERKGLIGIEDDSWEGGIFTWTNNFPEEFRKRRGYDLLPYLPVLTGCLIDGETKVYALTAYSVDSNGAEMGGATLRRQVQRDYKLTVSDLMADYHYGHLEKLCKANGLLFYSEAAGPDLHQADLLKNTSEIDMPMAEFWVPCFHRPQPTNRYLSRNAACASHIYGMPVNMDEAFTSLGPEWEESPFDMKPVSDRAFCDGVNRICVHNFSHSPSLTAKPGFNYVAGTHYDPRITWWEQVPAFNRYLARCSHLLQQGKFVADAVFYEGDDIGDGEPRKVIHPTLGLGYDYDCCNTDVLLHRMSVQNGRIVLPDGMSYRVLILPDNAPMAYDALQKTAHLIQAGATVVGPPPTGIAGLPLHPEAEQQFHALVANLWGHGSPSQNATKRKIGAGYLISSQSARQTLQDANVPPDFEYTGLSPEGDIYWIHRKTAEVEIYYVASHWLPAENLECTFRVSGRQPELWDPVTGIILDAPAFRQEGGRTVIPLQFDPCGSIFVVFRKPIPSNAAGTSTMNTPKENKVLLTVTGSWEVHFDPRWGGPKKATFDQLIDWTARLEPGIKFYSGTAVYRNSFDHSAPLEPGETLLLDLGKLHEIASVRLNGRDLGVLWTKPPRVDITDAARSGSNDLEITVVNLWPNRLIGDASLPNDSQLTQTNIHKFSAHSPLLPSGLIGPVRVLSLKTHPAG